MFEKKNPVSSITVTGIVGIQCSCTTTSALLHNPVACSSSTFSRQVKIKTDGERLKEKAGKGEGWEKAIVCTPLPPRFCSILLRMTSPAHPRRFLSPPPPPPPSLHPLLLFKLSQTGLSPHVSDFPHYEIICSAWCELTHNKSFIAESSVCVSGCCKTISWRDFLMMLHGTCPTCCPCESLSCICTHTNHATPPHPTGN